MTTTTWILCQKAIDLSYSSPLAAEQQIELAAELVAAAVDATGVDAAVVGSVFAAEIDDEAVAAVDYSTALVSSIWLDGFETKPSKYHKMN